MSKEEYRKEKLSVAIDALNAQREPLCDEIKERQKELMKMQGKLMVIDDAIADLKKGYGMQKVASIIERKPSDVPQKGSTSPVIASKQQRKGLHPFCPKCGSVSKKAGIQASGKQQHKCIAPTCGIKFNKDRADWKKPKEMTGTAIGSRKKERTKNGDTMRLGAVRVPNKVYQFVFGWIKGEKWHTLDEIDTEISTTFGITKNTAKVYRSPILTELKKKVKTFESQRVRKTKVVRILTVKPASIAEHEKQLQVEKERQNELAKRT